MYTRTKYKLSFIIAYALTLELSKESKWFTFVNPCRLLIRENHNCIHGICRNANRFFPQK